MIDRIVLTNWKGLTTELRPGKFNIFTGPNGSGKTAHLEALSFAVTGSTSLGDSLDATSKLISGRSGGVQVFLKDGFHWSRTLSTAKGNSQEIKVNGKKVSAKVGNELIQQKVGNFAPMFSLRKFLDMSSDKKIGFLTDLCRTAGGDNGKLDPLGNIVLSEYVGIDPSPKKGDELTAENDKLIAHLRKTASDARWFEHVNRVMVSVAKPQLQDIPTAINAVKDEVNSLRRQKKEVESTIQQLTERKSTVDCPRESLEQLKKDATVTTQQLAEVRSQLGVIEGSRIGRESLQREVDRLAAKVESLKCEPSTVDVDGVKAEIARLQATIVGGDDAHNLAELQLVKAKKLIEDETRCSKLVSGRIANETSIHKSNNWCRVHGYCVAALDDIAKEEVLSQLPVVKSAAAALSAIAGIADELADDYSFHALISDLEKQKSESDENVRQLESTLPALEKRLADAKLAAEKDDATNASIDALRTTVNRHEIDTACYASYQTAQTDLREATDRLNKLDGEAGHTDTATLNETANALTASLTAQNAKVEAKQRYQAVEQERASMVARHDDLALEVEAATAVSNALTVLRNGEMGSLVQPLLDKLRLYYGSDAPSCEIQGKSIDFGLGEGLEYRHLDALSGGEEAVYCAGLAYAMISLSESPLKVLLVESAEVDSEKIVEMLERLTVAEDIDHIFVATHLPVSHPQYDAHRMGLVPCEIG